MARCVFRIGPSAQRRLILSGLGGIGKTQLTISFLLQFLARFRHVLFIDGSSLQSIESGIITKVKSLGETYARTAAAESLDVLANPDHEITHHWAIVYDNVDDHQIDIARYFPKCAFGTIIVTTRNPGLANLAPKAHIRLDIMSEEQATDVLLRSAVDPVGVPSEAERRYANDIAKALGYLPVALVQAGYFIKQHDCMSDYLRRLEKRRPQILSRPAEAQLDSHYHGIYAALDVTWPQLSEQNRKFLSILGFVNYTGLPLALIKRAAARNFAFEPHKFAERPPEFSESAQILCDIFRPSDNWDDQDIDDLVAELERYSLVTRMTTFEVKVLRLHPLVHSWIQDRLLSHEREIYRVGALRLLVCGTSKDDEDILEFLVPHINPFMDQLDTLHPNDRAGIAAIFAYQEESAKAIALWEGIIREVKAQFEDEANAQGGRLLSRLAGQLWRGNQTNGVRLYEAKLQLARVYRNLGNDDQKSLAKAMEREAVEYLTKELGSEHPTTMKAVAQQTYGMASKVTLVLSQEYEQAQLSIRRVLEFWERYPEDHWQEILEAKEQLALISPKEQSISLRRQILMERIDRNGPDHHETYKAMEFVARGYQGLYQHDLDDSGNFPPNSTGRSFETDHWISLVAARTKRRGLNHPETIDAIERLAHLYSQESRFDMSIEQWKRAIDLRKEVQGSTHPHTLAAIGRLGFDYYLAERYKEAEAVLKEEIPLRKIEQGSGDPSTSLAMKLLADLYEKGERKRRWC
ncbi:hypothetical protein M408DRAFT_99244 [Serendipita vermifera MAFF 305830]|uniref:NB-ARC domain-containing protein n=1 Tax=Serendipita vermifera MAFF 305830 TaxID=933852 RepID=A0A0C3BER7_SERVB|nr:hypothetical protein M408DRAFT_99244 [Serendipita vermifera MAFF 305830]